MKPTNHLIDMYTLAKSHVLSSSHLNFKILKYINFNKIIAQKSCLHVTDQKDLQTVPTPLIKLTQLSN